MKIFSVLIRAVFSLTPSLFAAHFKLVKNMFTPMMEAARNSLLFKSPFVTRANCDAGQCSAPPLPSSQLVVGHNIAAAATPEGGLLKNNQFGK